MLFFAKMLFFHDFSVLRSHPSGPHRARGPDTIRWDVAAVNSCISELQRRCANNRRIGIIAVGVLGPIPRLQSTPGSS